MVMRLSWHLTAIPRPAAPAMPSTHWYAGIDTDGLSIHILPRKTEQPRSRFAGPSILVARQSIAD
jgi:hypothetical protein